MEQHGKEAAAAAETRGRGGGGDGAGEGEAAGRREAAMRSAMARALESSEFFLLFFFFFCLLFWNLIWHGRVGGEGGDAMRRDGLPLVRRGVCGAAGAESNLRGPIVGGRVGG